MSEVKKKPRKKKVEEKAPVTVYKCMECGTLNAAKPCTRCGGRIFKVYE